MRLRRRKPQEQEATLYGPQLVLELRASVSVVEIDGDLVTLKVGFVGQRQDEVTLAEDDCVVICAQGYRFRG